MRVFSTPMNLALLKHRSLSKTSSGSANTATAIGPVVVTATTLTRSTTTATFTATAAHRLATGQYVTIAGATPAAYNGDFQVTVTGATTFTYTMLSTPSGSGSGSMTATFTPHAQWAVIHASSDNTADLYIGPDVNCDLYPIQAGSFYTLPVPGGAKFDLSDWYVKSTGTSQAYTVLYV